MRSAAPKLIRSGVERGVDAERGSLGSAGGVLTVGSLWHDIAGRRLGDELLEWAPDLFASATTVDELATGRAWRICQALLTLHAIADESCAGTGVAVTEVPPEGHRFRARARELLARTGTLSRISRQRLRVLPCVRNTVGGPSIRSMSRYVCVRGPGAAEYGNVLLLPWPLRIDAEDFKPIGVVERAEVEPHGFFEFAPGELLDLDLADRVLQSARNQEGAVEIVVLPESALLPGDIDELEALLTRHGVWLVVA